MKNVCLQTCRPSYTRSSKNSRLNMADGIISTTRNQAPAAILINSCLLGTLMGFVNIYSLTVWIIHLQLMSYKSSFAPTCKLALNDMLTSLNTRQKVYLRLCNRGEIMVGHWLIISWLCLSKVYSDWPNCPNNSRVAIRTTSAISNAVWKIQHKMALKLSKNPASWDHTQLAPHCQSEGYRYSKWK